MNIYVDYYNLKIMKNDTINLSINVKNSIKNSYIKYFIGQMKSITNNESILYVNELFLSLKYKKLKKNTILSVIGRKSKYVYFHLTGEILKIKLIQKEYSLNKHLYKEYLYYLIENKQFYLSRKICESNSFIKLQYEELLISYIEQKINKIGESVFLNRMSFNLNVLKSNLKSENIHKDLIKTYNSLFPSRLLNEKDLITKLSIESDVSIVDIVKKIKKINNLLNEIEFEVNNNNQEFNIDTIISKTISNKNNQFMKMNSFLDGSNSVKVKENNYVFLFFDMIEKLILITVKEQFSQRDDLFLKSITDQEKKILSLSKRFALLPIGKTFLLVRNKIFNILFDSVLLNKAISKEKDFSGLFSFMDKEQMQSDIDNYISLLNISTFLSKRSYLIESSNSISNKNCNSYANTPEYTFLIYEYSIIGSIYKNTFFGDDYMDSAEDINFISYISLSESEILYINNKDYERLLKLKLLKERDNIVKYFEKHLSFRNFSYKGFFYKYFYSFNHVKINKNEYLLSNKHNSKEVYFLKTGEYLLSFKGNLSIMKNMIEDLLDRIRQYENEYKFEYSNEELDFLSNEEMKKIKNYNLNIICSYSIINLECLFDYKIPFDISVITSIGKYYRISLESFKLLIGDSVFLYRDIKKEYIKNLKFYIERLKEIRENEILTISKQSEEKERENHKAYLSLVDKQKRDEINKKNIKGFNFQSLANSPVKVRTDKEVNVSLLEKSMNKENKLLRKEGLIKKYENLQMKLTYIESKSKIYNDLEKSKININNNEKSEHEMEINTFVQKNSNIHISNKKKDSIYITDKQYSDNKEYNSKRNMKMSLKPISKGEFKEILFKISKKPNETVSNKRKSNGKWIYSKEAESIEEYQKYKVKLRSKNNSLMRIPQRSESCIITRINRKVIDNNIYKYDFSKMII